jgi:hypothetical protein
MGAAFRNIERAREEVTQLHAVLLQLESRVDSVRESLGNAMTELFGPNREAFPALQEGALVARIVEAVAARLPLPPQAPSDRRQYVREREAAAYMGVSVAALRRWRLLRSKNGPPFTRVGRMVLYPMAELESHLKAGLVPPRD